MYHMKKVLTYLFSIPKTIFFNFKYFSLKDAIRFPVLVSKNVYLMETKGKVILEEIPKFGMIKIGFGQVGIFDQYRSRSIWQVSGRVVFKGRANIGHGSKISVAGDLELGSGFTITAESSIVCNKQISFGQNALLSWENLIMDTDYHSIYDRENSIINPDKPIIIGDDVWIGTRCTILKGTVIGNDTIIAANSMVSGNHIHQTKVILGGNPAKEIKENVSRFKQNVS